MNEPTPATFTLWLLDGQHIARLEGLFSLMAEDSRGAFSLWPGHEPWLTVLEPGLFRYRARESTWRFGASAGGLLRCDRSASGETQIQMVSHRILQGDAARALQQQFEQNLHQESQQRLGTLEGQAHIDQALRRKLQALLTENTAPA